MYLFALSGKQHWFSLNSGGSPHPCSAASGRTV